MDTEEKEKVKKFGLDFLESRLAQVAREYDIRKDFYFFDRYLDSLRDLYQERGARDILDKVWGFYSDEDRVREIDRIYAKERKEYLDYVKAEGYDMSNFEHLKGSNEK